MFFWLHFSHPERESAALAVAGVRFGRGFVFSEGAARSTGPLRTAILLC